MSHLAPASRRCFGSPNSLLRLSTTSSRRLLHPGRKPMKASLPASVRSSSSSSPASMSTAAVASAPEVRFSAGSDEQALSATLEKHLLASGSSASPSKWALTAGGTGLQRSFNFKNFTKTWVSHASICDSLVSYSLGLGLHNFPPSGQHSSSPLRHQDRKSVV